MSTAQLPLPLSLDDRCLLESFHPGPNAVTFASIQALVEAADWPQAMYLWGPGATGKSHLLQALVAALSAQRQRASYLPLGQLARHGPALLEGQEQARLVALDDLDVVAGQADWETGLFALANALRNAGGCLLVAASVMPEPLGIRLPDLQTRLLAGGSFRLRRLEADEDLAELVRLRARQRGLDITPSALRWLLRHVDRGVPALLAALDALDAAALAERRQLTAALVREVLAPV